MVELHSKVSDMGRMAMDMLTRSMLQSIKATKHMATMVQRRFHPAGSVIGALRSRRCNVVKKKERKGS